MMDREGWTEKLESARALAARVHGSGGLVDAKQLLEALEELDVIGEELLDERVELEATRLAASAEGERYRRLFEFDPTAQVLTSIAGIVLEANRRARIMLALADRPRGHLADLLPAPAAPALRRCLAATRRHPAPFRTNISLTPDDPPMLVSVARERGDAGGKLRWMFYGADDPAGILQRAIGEQREAVAQKWRDDALYAEMMLAAIGHDLRNPIHAMLGLMELLLDERILRRPKERAQLKERIWATAQTVSETLDALLDRARQGPFSDLAVQELRVAPVAERALRSLPPTTHVIEVKVPSGIQVHADPILLHGIIVNALKNAIEHTPPETRIWVRATENASGVVLIIDDEGPGTPPPARARLAAPAYSTMGKGSRRGFGLSLIAGFAAEHGGTAVIEDRPGGGTRLKILFPHTRRPERRRARQGRSNEADVAATDTFSS